MNSPSEYGALLARNAKLEQDLERARGGHSNAKLVALVTIATALAGSPGFWLALNPPPPPPPPTIARTEFEAMNAKLDQIATDMTELKGAAREDRAKLNATREEFLRFADRYTPPNRARIPR